MPPHSSTPHAARRWHDTATHPLTGWIGYADLLAFSLNDILAPDIRRFLSGTPPILAIAALEASFDAFETVDLSAMRAGYLTRFSHRA